MPQTDPSDTLSKTAPGRLGTFAGVFTPSVLTILGIILFLRLGYVVGSAGLGKTLLIIALANGISVLTSISLAAIATNLKVKGGGDYYLISRTLGLEFGGSIGIVLFLAQSVSIAFYCIGFGEAVVSMLSTGLTISPRWISLAALGFLFVLAWLGADWATRFQFVVMALLIGALVSFFIGGIHAWHTEMLTQNWRGTAGSPGFWILFAIFFPAVTGFTQGVSMSGDLADPGKSLPLGTFLAVGISIVVYFAVAVVFAAAVSGDRLASDYGAMRGVSAVGFLIDAGVIAATLSSAMASFLGAPRILQSLAADRIFPFLTPFAKGAGAAGNPRRGVLLSLAIAVATVLLGNLNIIAPVVSMFFLISYGLLNYATYYEARTGSPSFRPRFRWFDQRLSLAGFLACLGVMLAIDLKTGIIAISILFAVFQYLRRTAGPSRWADSRRAYHLQQAREHLLEAAEEPVHPRDWSPRILAFSNDPQRRRNLLGFAAWIQGKSGMTTVVRMIPGEGLKARRLRDEAEKELRNDLRENRFQGFPLAVSFTEFESDVRTLVQSYGVGPIRANTILLNWVNDVTQSTYGFSEFHFGRNVRSVFRLGCNIIVLDADGDKRDRLMQEAQAPRRIDIWWQDDATGRLMLLFAYLMTRHPFWEDAEIRLFSRVDPHADPAEALQQLTDVLEESRIDAQPEIIADSDEIALVTASSDADIVFLPFRFEGNLLLSPSGNRLHELLPRLPAAVLFQAAEDIDLDAAPEEGAAAELAAAMDAYQEAEKRSETAAREAEEVRREAEARQQHAEATAHADPGPDDLCRAQEEAAAAAAESDKSFRKAAKAKVKADDAAQVVKDLGGIIDPPEDESPDKPGDPE